MYKKLWVIVGSYILDEWNYSCSTGIQPVSHKESIIVLLPKEVKDIENIKTISNNSWCAAAGKVLWQQNG